MNMSFETARKLEGDRIGRRIGVLAFIFRYSRQGSSSGAPVGAKSLVLRVTTVSP
jgi:hypothetical protein